MWCLRSLSLETRLKLCSLQRWVYMCVVPSSYRLPTGIKHSDCLTALLPTKVAAFNSGYCTNHQNCVCDRFPHLTVCVTVRWKFYPLHEIASPVKWLTSIYTMQDSMYSHITQSIFFFCLVRNMFHRLGDSIAVVSLPCCVNVFFGVGV